MNDICFNVIRFASINICRKYFTDRSSRDDRHTLKIEYQIAAAIPEPAYNEDKHARLLEK